MVQANRTAINAGGLAGRLRLLFFGMNSAFSMTVFKGLLARGINSRAVVLPGYGPAPMAADLARIPVFHARAENIADLAREQDIPVQYVRRLDDADTLETLLAWRPEVLLVACFPRLLPPDLLRLPRCGCLNLHPSLLPAYRGPDPLFWQFQRGERRTGVTLHLIDEGVDSGPVVAQQAVDLDNGLSRREAEQRLGAAGAALFAGALARLREGSLSASPQPAAQASRFPLPRECDYAFSSEWSARWAYNFIRGAGCGSCLFRLRAGERIFTVTAAVAFTETGVLGAPYETLGVNRVRVQLSPGTLTVNISTFDE